MWNTVQFLDESPPPQKKQYAKTKPVESYLPVLTIFQGWSWSDSVHFMEWDFSPSSKWKVWLWKDKGAGICPAISCGRPITSAHVFIL